ncbi:MULTISPECIES: hypothetical protein [Streptomyces]|uniref:Uncharacterized protein n=1 Tax=Streptomyces dengpaensis TaxID=2049881 RepID=A0ABM6T1I5_9ACTN|nr:MULTISPECIES: hypothetical protein [Streptomyces]AVH60861.1 hypothetical protein C4B68_39760 [Streptomyces dengpaensis]PIB00003.1 hypothetical protein B1C81_39090 [Streptomyces sp. HG99]
MLDRPVVVAARAAAREMSAQYGPRLEADIEEALRGGGTGPPDQYFDPVAAASLIVAVAQFAYQTYTQHKKDGRRPEAEPVVGAVRIERRRYTELTRAEEQIIEIVTAEVVRAAAENEPDGDAAGC